MKLINDVDDLWALWTFILLTLIFLVTVIGFIYAVLTRGCHA